MFRHLKNYTTIITKSYSFVPFCAPTSTISAKQYENRFNYKPPTIIQYRDYGINKGFNHKCAHKVEHKIEHKSKPNNRSIKGVTQSNINPELVKDISHDTNVLESVLRNAGLRYTKLPGTELRYVLLLDTKSNDNGSSNVEALVEASVEAPVEAPVEALVESSSVKSSDNGPINIEASIESSSPQLSCTAQHDAKSCDNNTVRSNQNYTSTTFNKITQSAVGIAAFIILLFMFAPSAMGIVFISIMFVIWVFCKWDSSR